MITPLLYFVKFYILSLVMDANCHVCGNAVGKAHQCIKCRSSIYIFLGITEGKKAMDKRLFATNAKINIMMVSVKNFLH